MRRTCSPHSAEHGKLAMQAVMRALGRTRQAREDSDDAGSEHLQSIQRVREKHLERGTHHTKLPAQLIRQKPKNDHPNYRTSKRQAGNNGAEIVCCHFIRAIDAFESCRERRLEVRLHEGWSPERTGDHYIKPSAPQRRQGHTRRRTTSNVSVCISCMLEVQKEFIKKAGIVRTVGKQGSTAAETTIST